MEIIDNMTIEKLNTLNNEQSKLFFQEIRNGNKEAKEKLIQLNDKFVCYIINHNFISLVKAGIEYNVLRNEGIIGLLLAANKYDYTKECKFSTFAYYYIEGTIKKYLRNTCETKPFKIKRDDLKLNNRINKYITNYENKYNTKPTNQQIAIALNEKIEKIDNISLIYGNHYSFNQQVKTEDNNMLLEELIEDTTANKEDYIDNKLLIEQLFDKMPSQQVLILKYKYYFNYSQREIADLLNISQPHVSRLLYKSLKNAKNILNNSPNEDTSSKPKKKYKNQLSTMKIISDKEINNMLCSQITKLNDKHITEQELKNEIKKSQAITQIAEQSFSSILRH